MIETEGFYFLDNKACCLFAPSPSLFPGLTRADTPGPRLASLTCEDLSTSLLCYLAACSSFELLNFPSSVQFELEKAVQIKLGKKK